jgi:uncharacterized protein
MEAERSLHELNDVEIRVLGSLMEKSKTTPDYYPMTVNSLTAACNQKSSRNPVVEYDEETVMAALRSLKGQNLVSLSIGGTSRTNKYKHNFDIVYEVSAADFAVLCLLFLRGPQTPGELNSNSGRLYEFPSLGAVYETLNKLADAQPPMVKELPKRAGQKEVRYMHLFGGTITETETGSGEEVQAPKTTNAVLEERLAAVEKELAEVKETVNKLLKELMG